MPRIIVTSREGEERSVAFDQGGKPTLMEAIRNEGSFDLVAMCGGMLSCSTCHVYVDPGWSAALDPRTDDEQSLVADSGHYRETSRLSCQIMLDELLDGLRVTIAPED